MAKGIVKVEIAKGRRELGWEVGYSAQGGLTTKSFSPAITLNNDADFVAKRAWIGQFGTNLQLDPRITVQMRDSTTGQVFFRQAGVASGLCAQAPVGPAQQGTGIQWSRFAANWLGLPAPYTIRRGSSVFFEFTNPSGLTIPGDIIFGFEGFRVYPGSVEDVPDNIEGYALPFVWNGTLAVSSSATNAVVKLGTITMPGLGNGHYVLKYGQCFTTALPTGVESSDVTPDCFLGMQIYTTKNQSKRLVHVTTPPTVGDFMPVSFFTGGGPGFPWFQPVYLAGTDTIFIDVYGNTTWFAGNTPGTIELQLNGVYVPA